MFPLNARNLEAWDGEKSKRDEMDKDEVLDKLSTP